MATANKGGIVNPSKKSSQLTGVSGVHYVASYLSFHGFHAVPTTRNVRGPDLLLSNLDGSKGVSLQVKATEWAMRTRGRGNEKKPHHYEWDIGRSSAELNLPHLFFALVDLRKFRELPNVFIVPSKVIFEYFNDGTTRRRVRYHPLIEKIDQYKNNLGLLKKVLGDSE
jgi:hypothetical protein